MSDKERKNKSERLERLKKELYGKRSFLPRQKRSRLRPREFEVQREWTKEGNELPLQQKPKKMPLTAKIFFGSIIFFLIAAGVSLFILLGGSNIISSRNVLINITGPVSSPAGEETVLQITIENRNNVPLEFADLLIEYPEGTRVVLNLEQELVRFRKSLGTIGAGERVIEVSRAVFFGQEGSKKEIVVTLEYRTQSSNAIFVAEKKYALHISSSPITLSVDTLQEVISGQEFEIEVRVVSNSNRVVRDLLVAVDYPFGFSFEEATPQPAVGNRVWEIGDLNPGVERSIIIRGSIEGQDGEEKIFRVDSGIPSALDKETIGIAYSSLSESVLITRPFLSVQLFLDGESLAQYAISARQTVRAEVVWTNNLPTRVIDAKIEAKLGGTALNKTSVSVQDGFYRSVDNTIIWDKGTFPELSQIEPGAKGKTRFRFSSQTLVTPSGSILKNPFITIEISISGNRLREGRVAEEIRNTISREVKINSDVVLAQRASYYTGPFRNSGPLPPQAEEETTYTIIWTVTNSSNNISRGEVGATLPPYMRWIGKTTLPSGQISFNETDRTVRWRLGRIKAGVGIISSPREVAFQVALLPSVAQIGQMPTLISGAAFSGKDEFTDSTLRVSSRKLDTNLSTDPQFKFGEGKVVE